MFDSLKMFILVLRMSPIDKELWLVSVEKWWSQDFDGKVQVLEMDSAEQQRKVQSLEVAGGRSQWPVSNMPLYDYILNIS